MINDEQADVGSTQEDVESVAPAPAAGVAKRPAVCRQLARPMLALGISCTLLRRKPPFSNFNFGRMTSVVIGQIRRRHYLIAFRGNDPVGYIGWAVTTSEIANRWLTEGYSPKYHECLSGDCCVLLTVYSEERDVTMSLIRQARIRYPGHRIFFMRDYAKKKKSRKAHVLNVAAQD